MILEINDYMNNFLPGFVIGFEPNIELSLLEDRIREFEAFPNWFISIFAQVGSTRYIEYRQLIGTLLQFQDNIEFILDNEQLLHLFALITKEWFGAVRKHFPEFSVLNEVYEYDKPYTAYELELLYGYFSKYLSIPKIEKGIEAFLEFEECELFEFVNNWLITSFHFDKGFVRPTITCPFGKSV